MDKFFNQGNIFFRFMDKVADFLIINLLTVLCCLPVFTIGAALTAAHKMMQNIVLGDDQPLFKPYFQAFTRNFKQATILWVVILLAFALLVADTLLVYLLLEGLSVLLLYGLLLIVTVLLFGLTSYVFPLLARYENTLKNHIFNAMILCVGNLPRTIIMLVVNAVPLLLAIVDLSIFFKTLFVWIFFGVSILVYLETKLICPVFQKHDQKFVNKSESVEQK